MSDEAVDIHFRLAVMRINPDEETEDFVVALSDLRRSILEMAAQYLEAGGRAEAAALGTLVELLDLHDDRYEAHDCMDEAPGDGDAEGL